MLKILIVIRNEMNIVKMGIILNLKKLIFYYVKFIMNLLL